jgi:monoamine oxidase
LTHYGAVSQIVGPVVVVGAGIACVVLEARDRIGGRLHTVDTLSCDQ